MRPNPSLNAGARRATILTIDDIRAVPLFSTLALRELERLAQTSADLHLAAGEYAAHEDGVHTPRVTWRRLAIEGFDWLIGKGIYYGAARSEANATHGLDVHLIGAGNSAGHAAMYFANHARTVTLVLRGDSLAASMSHYLIEQLSGKSNVTVQLRSEVVAAHGDAHLTAIDIRDGGALVAQPRSLPPRDECSRCFRLWGCAVEPGQARGLRGRRGQHGHRFRPHVSAGGRAVAFRAKGAR